MKSPVYDKIFCVFDYEKAGEREARIREAKEKAEEHEYCCIISNPCFEYWILLHFEKGGYYKACKDVERKLKNIKRQGRIIFNEDNIRDGKEYYGKTEKFLSEAMKNNKKASNNQSSHSEIPVLLKAIQLKT